MLDLLVCPQCGGALTESVAALDCAACALRYPQSGPEAIELMPPGFVADHPGWSSRQDEMTRWYDSLRADPARAAQQLTAEIAPLAPALGVLQGTVLDLGGGLGLPRRLLPRTVRYVALEPDPRWSDAGWRALEPALGGLGLPPPTVRGVGEQMPFGSAVFDAALALWSINHVDDPSRVVDELARVLRPGARLILVLDEVEPRWSDLLHPGFPAALRGRASWAKRKLKALAAGWQVSSDHLAVSERDLAVMFAGRFVIRRRWWFDGNLVVEAVRR